MKRLLLAVLLIPLAGCAALQNAVGSGVDTTQIAVGVGGVQQQITSLIKQGCSDDSITKLEQVNQTLTDVDALLIANPTNVDTTAVAVGLQKAQVVANALVGVACSPEFSNGLLKVGMDIQDVIKLLQ